MQHEPVTNSLGIADQPDCLKGLTDIEEMLIACIKPNMQVHYTKGRQLCYKDHIINLPQDITEVAERLPRLPQDLDVVIIRRQDENLDRHVDYLCRRAVLYNALVYKIAHDLNYADLQQPDEQALLSLPVHGSVAGMIPVCFEGGTRMATAATGPTGPMDAANPLPQQNNDDDGNEQFVGGILNVGPPRWTETEEVRQGVQEILQGPLQYERNIINVPPADARNPINENTPGYMSMAFPTLFPDGKADFNQPRLHKVELGEYFKHLLCYKDGRFARHRRFPWFMFNTLQRHRTHSQARIFVRQNQDAGRMTIAEMQELLNDGDKSLAHNMMRYGAGLRGTRAYWLARRRELLDMIRIRGSPHLFFTLSAADLQWDDLHQHMPMEVPHTEDPTGRRQRRAALNNNPHIAAAYLDERIQVFMTKLVHPLLGVVDFWYRYEWQERGSGHIHGFLWLKDAPNPDDIDWNLLKEHNHIIPEDQEVKMRDFVSFWGGIMTAVNPFPRADDNTPLVGLHPCRCRNEDLQDTKEELAELLNWVERHNICRPGYCQVKRKVPGQGEPQTFCRFDFPMTLCNTANIGLDSKHRVHFEPKRSDPLLNTFNVPMILGWRANIDVKPVLSKDAAIK